MSSLLWIGGSVVVLVLALLGCCNRSYSVINLGRYRVETINGKTRVCEGSKILANLRVGDTFRLPDSTLIKAVAGGHEIRRPNGSYQYQSIRT